MRAPGAGPGGRRGRRDRGARPGPVGAVRSGAGAGARCSGCRLPRTSPPASRACAASCCRRRRGRCSRRARIRPRSAPRPSRCVTTLVHARTSRPLRSAGRHVSVRPRGYYHPGGRAGPCRTLGRVTEEPVDVLIVDDQRPFRSVARTVVNLVGGWRVAAEAETGEDAVAAAERVRPGVVLMDINCPGSAASRPPGGSSRRTRRPRVVLLSTYSAADLPADATTCGATTYLNKEDLCPATLRARCDNRNRPALTGSPSRTALSRRASDADGNAERSLSHGEWRTSRYRPAPSGVCRPHDGVRQPVARPGERRGEPPGGPPFSHIDRA